MKKLLSILAIILALNSSSIGFASEEALRPTITAAPHVPEHIYEHPMILDLEVETTESAQAINDLLQAIDAVDNKLPAFLVAIPQNSDESENLINSIYLEFKRIKDELFLMLTQQNNIDLFACGGEYVLAKDLLEAFKEIDIAMQKFATKKINTHNCLVNLNFIYRAFGLMSTRDAEIMPTYLQCVALNINRMAI